ncbi:MAG TPA: hypothetical protein PKD23_06845 [Bellilinea sp.]|nr:hypothetical protein [Bellilinea sp.]
MKDATGEELNYLDQVFTEDGSGTVSGRVVYPDNRQRVLIALDGGPARLTGSLRGPGVLLAYDPQTVRKVRAGIFLPMKTE